MAKKFTPSEWKKIIDLANVWGQDYGLPKKRNKSVVIGTFNIRKLGDVKKRSLQAWDFLGMICERFDLLAIQEIQDDLSGIQEIKKRLGKNYGLVVSDVTGVFPGEQGNAERLAFLFNWRRMKRTELASDITYDRTKVINTLAESYQKWNAYIKKLGIWKEKVLQANRSKQKKPSKPKNLTPPGFLTFIRQPHCASFQVRGKNGTRPYDFLVVNTHLLYGTNYEERKWEFDALIEWLNIRAKQIGKLYHKNILMMGDCNLEFDNNKIKRTEIDDFLKSLNKTTLKSKKAAKVNFPLLDEHRLYGPLRTNARLNQTYDQIAIYAHDKRLPEDRENDFAPQGPDTYDFGVFNFTNLFANALYKKNYRDLNLKEQKRIIARTEHDISDHMPAWIRLPIPGSKI